MILIFIMNGVSCVPMTLGAYMRDADDTSFLLRRCVHSPGATAGCPGQHNYSSVPNPKKQTQSPKKWKMWAFRADFGSVLFFGSCFFFGTEGIEIG